MHSSSKQGYIQKIYLYVYMNIYGIAISCIFDWFRFTNRVPWKLWHKTCKTLWRCSLHLYFWSTLSKCCKHLLLYLHIFKKIYIIAILLSDWQLKPTKRRQCTKMGCEDLAGPDCKDVQRYYPNGRECDNGCTYCADGGQPALFR